MVNKKSHQQSLIPVPRKSLSIPKLSSENDFNSLKLSLVIPCYNESKNINKLIYILTKVLNKILQDKYEIIIADDNSPDKTWKTALKLTDKYPQLKVMRRESERGLATAVIRGWQVSRGEVLGVIDGDLQHPPEKLKLLWGQIIQGADLAVASRNVEGGGVSEWSLLRRFLSRGAQIVGLILLPGTLSRLSDPMSGYFLVRRDTLINRIFNPSGYKILLEVVARGKIRWIAEVGYIFQERKLGASKVTFKQYFQYLHHLLRLRFDLWPVKRFLRFGISGFSGVFVNMAILFVFREYLGLGLTRSAIFAAEVSVLNNFIWNDIWTFRDISQAQKGWKKMFRRFLKFNLICLSGLILNVLFLNLLFNVFGINDYLANLMAIALVTFWNFWFNLKLSWRVSDTSN